MPPLGKPLAYTKFTLNSAGVAGFFGGEEAIEAMATVHLYKGRRWLGWFNSPGSYTVAKRFGRMANSRFWDGLFPGSNDSPAVSFELDGKPGPEYIAALSGTKIHRTGHLGYLMMKKSKDKDEDKDKDKDKDKNKGVVKIGGRETKPMGVAYLAMKKVNFQESVECLPLKDALLGLIPIAASVVACVMCALVCDWYSFSMILLGIISSGLASYVIGNGKLVIKPIEPAEGVPPGHGILIEEDQVVVIKGEERDVNAITKGGFDLKTDEGKSDEESGTVRKYHAIGLCSLLLIVQFLLQLLLIPQGSLFGQIMFLASLGVSWIYNSYLSSLEKEKIQTRILFKTLEIPDMLRFRVGTRTTMAVFVCLLLFHNVEFPSPAAERELRMKFLNSCLPNDTAVWQQWKKMVVQQLLNIGDTSESFPYLQLEEDEKGHQALSDAEEKDLKLLKDLLGDAHSALLGYFSVRNDLPADSSLQEEGQ